ncbi:hypothetical protein MGSAQ_000948 [marine sediment metagenome]|uniref:Uncharacterized protein n=1 Tax=marine sediment metagenome TaxID=412755 RepID=A0A1B6NVS9_9ZZZZ
MAHRLIRVLTKVNTSISTNEESKGKGRAIAISSNTSRLTPSNNQNHMAKK